MKTLLILFLATTFSFNAYAQSIQGDIEEIRKQFKWINSQKDFEKFYFENDEFTDQTPSEGCEMEIYYKKGNIYKIIESCGGANRIYTTEFYLKNNKLIFVYANESEYTRIGNGNVTDPEVYYENRIYYKDGKIIRHLEKGASTIDKPIDYQKLYNEYQKTINTKVRYEKQYNLLQGTWINTDDIDDWFHITGLKAIHYNKENYRKTSRIWLDGRYLWMHNTEYKEEDGKFEVLELTAEKLELQNKLSGELLVYKKK